IAQTGWTLQTPWTRPNDEPSVRNHENWVACCNGAVMHLCLCDFVSNIRACARKHAQEAPQACERDLLAPSLRGAEKLIHLEVAMPARLAFLPAFLIAAILSSVAPPISRGQTGAGGTDCPDVTLDVRLQTARPGPVIARLQAGGIRLIGVLIDNNEKTPSTHIYVGRFGSA